MNYLKTYENFSVGGHEYILVTADKKYYVKTTSIYNIDLMRLDNTTMKKLQNLKLTKTIWYLEEAAFDLKNKLVNSIDKILNHQVTSRFGAPPSATIKVKFEDGLMYQTEYTEESLRKMPMLKQKMVDTDTRKFDTEKVKEIINGLRPMRIFVGAFEDENDDMDLGSYNRRL